MFETFSEQGVILGLCVLLIVLFATRLYQWGWNRGYKTAKAYYQGSRRQRQAVDTQENVYGRIKNALQTFQKRDDQQRGIHVVPLADHFEKGIYTINVFWKNEFHATRILVVHVFMDSIHIESSNAPCPHGKNRNYKTLTLEEATVENVISDVKTFIAETYAVAYQNARAGAR